jgi:lipid-A-disaccharide synthase-like uncharacterized protein
MIIKEVIGILGLILIILGNLTIYKPKSIRRKYTYPLLILGGIFLTVYSILIKDTIFIILQVAFILSAIYGLIKIHKRIKLTNSPRKGKLSRASSREINAKPQVSLRAKKP